MNWQGTQVLVTGAAGFIGSHLVERLVSLGARTRGFVHYNSQGSAGWLDTSKVRRDVEIIAGDVTDRDSVLAAMRGVDTVFHLAALIAIPYSYRAPASYVKTNIEGTLSVLQCAKELGVRRTVHTSTSEVYGTARYVPIDEGHPLQGQSPYSASKIAADKLAEAFHLSYELPVVTIRPFNTYGPRQSSRAVIPSIIGQCLTGNVVNVGNTRPTRDLNYVTDTVEGFVLAASRDDALGSTINLGSGNEIAIGDLALLIGKLLGKDIRLSTEQDRVRPANSEVERLLADNRRAKEMLGWKSTISLKEGLRRTIDWIMENSERYQGCGYVI